MHVSFFKDGPDEPPFVAAQLTAVPRIGETVCLRVHWQHPWTKYEVTGVEWYPTANAVNIDVAPKVRLDRE